MSNTLIQSLRAERDMAMKDAHDARQALRRARKSEAALLAALRPLVDALYGHHTEECGDGQSSNCVECDDAATDRLLELAHAAIAKAEGR